jgi:hypothetical protein
MEDQHLFLVLRTISRSTTHEPANVIQELVAEHGPAVAEKVLQTALQMLGQDVQVEANTENTIH